MKSDKGIYSMMFCPPNTIAMEELVKYPWGLQATSAVTAHVEAMGIQHILISLEKHLLFLRKEHKLFQYRESFHSTCIHYFHSTYIRRHVITEGKYSGSLPKGTLPYNMDIYKSPNSYASCCCSNVKHPWNDDRSFQDTAVTPKRTHRIEILLHYETAWHTPFHLPLAPQRFTLHENQKDEGGWRFTDKGGCIVTGTSELLWNVG